MSETQKTAVGAGDLAASRGIAASMPSSCLTVLATMLFLVQFSACTSIGRMTAGPQGRQQMLSEILPNFHRSIYWGKFEEAAVFVPPEKRASFVTRRQADRRKENLVEVQVENVEFGPESDTATVDVVIKYFKNTTYMVENRMEQETWQYSSTDGWLFQKSEDKGVLDANQSPPLGSHM
jgi:hypothetical protein